MKVTSQLLIEMGADAGLGKCRIKERNPAHTQRFGRGEARVLR
jgi:hypothetical protein